MIDTDQLVDGMMAKIDSAFQEGAMFMSDKLHEILGVQADVTYITGVPKAIYTADPGAPPRRVSGRLQSFVGWVQDAKATYSFGVMEGVFYARTLEYRQGHPFFTVLVHNNIGALTQIVSSQLQ